MKIRFTILLLITIVTSAIGQDKILSSDSDTAFWFKYYKTYRNKIGLEATDKIDSKFYFRFWDGSKVIELRQKEDKYIGTVTFLLQQYKKNKEGRLYFTKNILTDKTTNLINELLTKYRISELPTDKQINGWDGGLDGIIYITEFADPDQYSFKNYWTPEIYKDKIPEAKMLIDFITQLNEIEELRLIGKKFMNRQPFSSWYTFIGSATIAVKVY
jgi:hypothetical protein